MALWSDQFVGLRRLRSLLTNMPPDSVTALRLSREGEIRASAPRREFSSMEAIERYAELTGGEVRGPG